VRVEGSAGGGGRGGGGCGGLAALGIEIEVTIDGSGAKRKDGGAVRLESRQMSFDSRGQCSFFGNR
jgi:hypothetical protein